MNYENCESFMMPFWLFWLSVDLRKASLLPNEMKVLCNSPAHHRGIPAWNVSRCVNTTAAVETLTTNDQTLDSAGRGIEPSTLISLIGKDLSHE